MRFSTIQLKLYVVRTRRLHSLGVSTTPISVLINDIKAPRPIFAIFHVKLRAVSGTSND